MLRDGPRPLRFVAGRWRGGCPQRTLRILRTRLSAPEPPTETLGGEWMIESEAPQSRGWPRVVPFAVFIGLMVAEPYLAEALEPILDPRWLYGIRAAITGGVLLGLWRHYRELRVAGRVGVQAWVLGAIAGAAVCALWVALDFPPLVTGENEGPFDPRVGGTVHPGFALTRLAGAALVVPVMEELFWRSFLMRWLEKPRFLEVDPVDVGWKPLVMTSAVFALEHRLWFAGLLAGLVYGELYRRTGSLWVAILAHAVTNAALGVYVLVTGNWGFW